MNDDIAYRLLPHAEFERLKDLMCSEGCGDSMPDPRFCRVIVAERDNVIVAFLVCQVAIHMEPLWIAPEERGSVNWRRMVHMHEENLLSPFYVFAPNERIASMCKAVGMQKQNWEVFMKEASCLS
jgi:hypothetical protein